MATIERSFDVSGPVTLRLVIPEGELDVRTSAALQVEVQATALRGGREAAESLVIEATERAGGCEVLVEAPAARFGRRRASFAVRISLPEGSSVETKTASADLRARGALGDVTVNSASGDVSVEDVASLTIASASGDVAGRHVGRDAMVKTTSGDVELRSIGGDLVVSVVSGDVQVGTLGGECQVSTVSGDVEIGALGGRTVVNAVSGDVELGVPPGLSLWLDVRSASGDVRSDLDVEGAPASGGGTPTELTARTVSGDIRIRRAAV
jgi:DUF4097 and DUF4098 domain-containing protein YvlB